MRYKVIGGVLGLFFGGPIGAIIGFWIGSRIDRKARERASLIDGLGGGPDTIAAAVVSLAAKLAKADGEVTADEIRAFKRIFKIPPDQDSQIAQLWTQARAHAAGYEPYARQLALAYRHQPMMLEQIYIALEQIAYADGRVSPEEREMLRTVAGIFKLRDLGFAADGDGGSGFAGFGAADLARTRAVLGDLLSPGTETETVLDKVEQTEVRVSESVIRREASGFADPAVKLALAVVAGGIAFWLAHSNAAWPWAFPYAEIVLNLIPAAAVAGLVYLLLPRRPSLRDELADAAKKASVDVDDMVEAIQTARGRINEIKRIADRLDANIRNRLQAICEIANRILDGFREDPEDFRRSRRVLGHYLIATEDLAKRYAELAGRGADNARVREVFTKFEPVLIEIEDLFQRQYARNFDDDARRLDIDIDVLRETIKAEAV